jgi:hypothetical protein
MMLELRHRVGDRVPRRILAHENVPEWPRFWVAVEGSGVKYDEAGSLQSNRQRRAAYTTEGVPIGRRLSQKRRFVDGYEIATADPVKVSDIGYKLRRECRAGGFPAARGVAVLHRG